MGISLMARAFGRRSPAAAAQPIRIDDVTIGEPVILTTPRATARVQAARGVAQRSPCAVETEAAAGRPVRHFEAWIGAGSASGGAPMLPASVSLCRPAQVGQADIDTLFFHGPAFRVVRGATLVDGAMRCEMQTDPPALTRRRLPGGLLPEPRWIELCMQAAGLLAIATDARMMIPQHIGRIETVPAPPADPPRRLFAYAGKASHGGGFYMERVDQDRRPRLRVIDYRARALPFPSDPAAARGLAQKFAVVRPA